MSASREKKTRVDQTGVSRSDPKTAREAQQRKEARRSNILYAVIAVVFVAVAIASFVWKSNIIQKKATAATINGQNYTAAEVSYYYKNAYQSFLSNYSSYLSIFGLDTSKSLKEQDCAMTEDGTWYDYFMEQGLKQMCDVHALVDAAAAEGYQYPDSIQTDLDATMKSLEASASQYGYTVAQYLSTLYNATMTRSIYEAQLLLALQAQSYAQSYQDSLSYADSDLVSAYESDKNAYDMVDYEYVRVSGAAASTTDAEGNPVDPTDEAKSAALADAKALADSIYADYRNGGNLSDLADANDSASYSSGETGTYSAGTAMDWLFDTARQAGDSAVLDDSENSAYYVAVFHQRFRPDFDTVNVRHILIAPEATTLTEEDEGYAADVAEKKAAAEQKANDLLAQWKSGEATEDSFAALAVENSSDSGSASQGGLISQVSKMSNLVENFKNWAIDSGRKPGDVGVVESDYGYHIMYFAGVDLPYWKVQVTNTLMNSDFGDWYDGLTADYTAEQHASGLKYVS